MPDPLTLGHLLILAGGAVALYGALQLAIMLANRSHGPGTPQYARARDGRRFGTWAILAAILLVALGAFTPLGGIALT